MSDLFSNESAELTCPSCRRKFKESFGRLKNSPTVNCPGCHQAIKIEASDFKRGLDNVQREIDKIDDLIKGINKRR